MAVTPFATYQDFLDRYGEDFLVSLTDMQNTGLPLGDRINLAASDATDQIYAKLGRKYEVPTNPVPQLLVRICTVLAVWDLGLTPEGGLGEDWREAKDDAWNLIQSIADGDTTLGEDDPDREDEGPRNPVTVTYTPTVNTPETLSRY